MIADLKKRSINLLNVPPQTDKAVNVDGILCVTAEEKLNLYVIALIALGVVIVVVAIFLFFVQIYLARRRHSQTCEQSSLQIRINAVY
jgi:heme/copper-type cytochrome/quinol oxidase subunit 2